MSLSRTGPIVAESALVPDFQVVSRQTSLCDRLCQPHRPAEARRHRPAGDFGRCGESPGLQGEEAKLRLLIARAAAAGVDQPEFSHASLCIRLGEPMRVLAHRGVAQDLHDQVGRPFHLPTDGPFDLDIVFAPEGIENYAAAKRRAVTEGIFPVANIRDIIASKKASNRMKDRMDLHLLDRFRIEYELRR